MPRINPDDGGLLADHETLGRFRLVVAETPAEWLFTENETNPKVHGGGLLSALGQSVGLGGGPHKDSFHEHVVGR